MAHTVNLGDSLVKVEVDASHLAAGFIRVVKDKAGDYHYERLDPVLVIVKETP